MLRLMRPGDWVKNVFVLPALVFSLPRLLAESPPGATDLRDNLVATAVAFAAYCLLSSGFYALNDVRDAPSDRLHPTKRGRPVASGAVTPRAATVLGLSLAAAGLLAGFLLNSALGVVLLFYAGLQIAYNLKLKQVMLVDVVTVAIGFALRAAGGAVAINVRISVWLILCVFFLCLYLGFVKRLCDIASVEKEEDTKWTAPAGYDSRTEVNWLLGVSAVLAVVTYLMYSLSEHTRALFGEKSIGFALLTPLVLIAIHRFYRRASVGLSDSPGAALMHDRAVLASVALFAIGTVCTLYVPAVGELIEKVFFIDAPVDTP